MIGALFGGIAIGFLLGAIVGPAIKRAAEERLPRKSSTDAPGSTPFTGPIGAEGGGFDGEPLA
ncbi:MAG: hypothetical protein JO233_01115 [Candidatus Eremiobacteraeota bacterium]|nr:hypothetical protein [Candidatus Eremiobacteraeota bacterium]